MKAILLILLAVSLAAAGIEITVTGNTQFRAGLIKESLPPDPEEFSEDEMAAWRDDALFNAEDMYRRVGFFDARIDIAVRRKEGGRPEDWLAEVAIQEGARYGFDTVRVVLVDTIGADTVAMTPQATQALAVDPEDLDAAAGEPFHEDLLYRDRRFILRHFGNAGFVRAQVEDRLTLRRATRKVTVDYLVQPSYPVVFDTLILRNRRARPADTAEGLTDEGILRGLVPYKRGDTMRVSTNDRLIEKLQYTGAYNFVRLKDSLRVGEGADDGRTGGMSALQLHTEERVPGSFRTSLFYETDNGAGVSVDARHGNVAGTLNEARAGASLATDRQSSYAGFGSPLTMGRLIRIDLDASVSWRQNLPIHEDQGLFGGDFENVNSARATIPYSYWLRMVSSANLEFRSRMIEAGLERDLNLNFIQTGFASFLNQTMDPTRGIRLALTFGNGGPLYREDAFRFAEFRHNWVEGQSAWYWYYPPLREFKFAFRADGGRFFGEGETNTERFFLGGPRSIRNQAFRRVCPAVDTGGACITSGVQAAYFLLSQEVRIEPFAFGFVTHRGFMKHLVPLQLVPFYDFGKVWDLDPGPFEDAKGNPYVDNGRGEAFGLGFRYPLLGIFNLRLDLAYGLRNDRGAWPDAFVLDLAQAF